MFLQKDLFRRPSACRLVLSAFLVALFALSAFASGGRQAPVSKQTAQKRLNAASHRFIQNNGQWDKKVKFLARGKGMNLWVVDDGLVFDQFRDSGPSGAVLRNGQAVHMGFVGGSKDVDARPEGSMRGIVDYFDGKTKSHTSGSYDSVYLRSAAPGVSARLYFDNGKPRYDLVVAANVKPELVKLKFDGASSVKVNGKGDLVIGTGYGDVIQAGLKAYQFVDGKKKSVVASFKVTGKNQVGFALSGTTSRSAVVVDPLIYGSYYGGDEGMDEVRSVLTDIDSGVFMTGYTQSTKFPAIYGPYGFNLVGFQDAFLSKLQGDSFNHDYAAYITGSIDQVGEWLAQDPYGNIWIAGQTRSSDFPGNTRPNVQFLNLKPPFQLPDPSGGFNPTFTLTYIDQTTAPIPWNATAAQVQSALLALPRIAAAGAGACVCSGGPLFGVEIRIQLANSLPAILVVDNTHLGAQFDVVNDTYSTAQLLYQTPGSPAATGGTFTITYAPNGANQTTAPIPYNASFAQVQAALQALPALGANVKVELPLGAQTLPTGPYIVQFIGALANTPQEPMTVNIALLQPTNASYQTSLLDQWELFADRSFSQPNSGTFVLLVTNAIGTVSGFTAPIRSNASAATIKAAIEAVPGVGANSVQVDAINGKLPLDRLKLIFYGPAFLDNQVTLTIFNNLKPVPVYGIDKFNDVFIMRWAKDPNTILNPLPTKTFMFGGDKRETIGGFGIKPNPNPGQNDPIDIWFAGEAIDPVPDIPDAQNGQDLGYVANLSFANGNFGSLTPATSKFVHTSGLATAVTGLVVDAAGNVYLGGTVLFKGNADTSLNSGPFQTTPGVFFGGRLLRNTDTFVRKYDASGNLVYSALLGGNGDDVAGGTVTTPEGDTQNAGSCIAIDALGNLFITGIAHSFNFPRTRNTLGPVFGPNPEVFVTKINSDASKIVYSTSMNTNGNVTPSGIAVDVKGDAFITGNLMYSVVFPFPPPFPDLPVQEFAPSVLLTGDAAVGSYTVPNLPQMPTTIGFLNVIDPAATSLLYGTLLGGSNIDNIVFAPTVSSFGDVWVPGWTDSFRIYGVPGVALPFVTQGALANSLISPLAFKVTPDASQNATGVQYAYDPIGLPFVNAAVRRDGFITSFRIGLSTIKSITLNPTVIPGGLGASTTGTVTLSQPAPVGGVNVALSLDNLAVASFSSGSPLNNIVIVIPSGATTGTFTVFSNPVTTSNQVKIKADFEGSFQIAQLTVAPWLFGESLSPTTTVGGNNIIGRVTLLAPAPAGGVTVALATDGSGLLQIPASVTVPAGQTFQTFTITSSGVATATQVPVTATLLGVGFTQLETLTPANLVSVVFSPPRVMGGATTTGTINLDGQAGAGFSVNLTIDTLTAYVITPTTVTFSPGATSATFTVQTPYESANVVRHIVATRPAQGSYTAESVSGTLFVDNSDLTSFTLSSNNTTPGNPVTGTVTVNKVAEDGGTVVNLVSSNPDIVGVPAQVIVPSGQTTVTFPVAVTSFALTTTQTAIVTASRGPVSLSQPLTLAHSNVTFTVNPSSVRGGNSVTGTLTLDAPAGFNGLTLNLSSDTSAAVPPATVTFPYNSTTATFSIDTRVETVQIVANLAASNGQIYGTTQLTVRPVQLVSISFSPNTLRGGGNTVLSVQLDGQAPAGGATIMLSSTGAGALNLPSSVTVPAYWSYATYTISTNTVSRPVIVTVTGVFGNSSSSTAVLINP